MRCSLPFGAACRACCQAPWGLWGFAVNDALPPPSASPFVPPSSPVRRRFDELRAERVAKYQGMNLYVKNLHDDIDDETLRTEFSQVRACCTRATVRCAMRWLSLLLSRERGHWLRGHSSAAPAPRAKLGCWEG